MSARHLSTKEQERFESPHGWDFGIYSFQPKNFWYSKTTLPLWDGCELVRYDFRGHIRYRAAMHAPKLQIDFIDSYSSLESRLQGHGKIESIVMISLGGDEWDGLTDVGALGIEINFDEKTAQKILTPETQFLLKSRIGRGRSVICHVSPAAGRLKARAQRYLSLLDQHANLPGVSSTECIEEFGIELNAAFQAHCSAAENTMIEMARNVIEEITAGGYAGPEISSMARREIALKLEKMLWRPPFLQDEDFEGTLEEFARIFSVSTRTVQLAVQEQFGVGFVALRRIIRQTQVRRAILASKGDVKLTEIASEYGLHFGRLSRYYKEQFGVLPSEELEKLRHRHRGRD